MKAVNQLEALVRRLLLGPSAPCHPKFLFQGHADDLGQRPQSMDELETLVDCIFPRLNCLLFC
jgi:hypothetical protein